MSMTAAQSSAFQAGGGFSAQDSMILLAGLVLTIALIFVSWALGSGYRGWCSGQLSNAQFGALVLKAVLIYLLLAYLLLS